MKTPTEYLDAVKARHGLKSDYALAKFLEIGKSQLANYRTGTIPDEYTAALIADALNLDQREVIAACNALRAERAEKAKQADYWERLWRQVRQTAATAIIALLVSAGFPEQSMASKATADAQVSLLHALMRRLARFLRTSPHAVPAA